MDSALAKPNDILKGTVERVTFHNAENGFCVLRVKVSGHRDLLTVIGNASNIQAGEYIECQGAWFNDKKHGLQFKTTTLKNTPPSSLEGMERYLASGMIKGIGPAYAKRLLNTFKDKVFEIIEQAPHRLCEVEGIGQMRKDKIVQAWGEQKKVREIMVFLHGYGIGTARAVRIYKTYGDKAIAKLQENPYRLAHDIHGIGFKTADKLAGQLGIAKDSILRLRAGVTFCLQEITNNGHCGIEKNTLIEKTSQELEVEAELIYQAIADEKTSNRIVEIEHNNEIICFLSSLFNAEKSIAAHCLRLLEGTTTWAEINIPEAIRWVQEKTGLQLSPSQQHAVETVVQNKVAIITGGPGVGKTTIVNSIIQIIKNKNVRIMLAAPTGRAAKRLEESTQLEAKTIHRLLEYDPQGRGFKRHEDSPLAADFVVVDECSMVDVSLMHQLLRAIPSTASLLLVGDVDQLPSVGPGMVLKDLIDSKVLPTLTLTEIFRQAATSQIITNAHRINQGKMPLTPDKQDLLSDFYTIHCQEVEKIKETVLALVTKRIPLKFEVNPIQDIQVLTPIKRGSLGTISFNIELQKLLNPQKTVVEKYGNVYGIGDKVLQIINNYDKDIFNGDIGTIQNIDLEENTLWIDFDGRIIEYDFSELDEINLAYATTIHKSQGSEYPVVVIPLATQHFTLLERNLLYTGVTRGKKLVVLVGQKQAIAMAIHRLQAQKRTTYLKQLLLNPI